MIEKKQIIRSLSLFLIGGLCLGLISGCQPGSTGNTGLPAGSDSADGSEEESFSDPDQGEMKEPDGTDTETQESVTSSVMSDNELLVEAVKQLVTREYWVTTDGTKKCCILLENPVKVDITVDFTVKYCDPEENVLGEEKFTVDIPACGKRFVELTKTFSEEEIFADLYFDLNRCRRVKPLQSEFDCEAETSEGAVVSFIIGNHSEYTAENLSVYFVFWKENTPVSRVPYYSGTNLNPGQTIGVDVDQSFPEEVDYDRFEVIIYGEAVGYAPKYGSGQDDIDDTQEIVEPDEPMTTYASFPANEIIQGLIVQEHLIKDIFQNATDYHLEVYNPSDYNIVCSVYVEYYDRSGNVVDTAILDREIEAGGTTVLHDWDLNFDKKIVRTELSYSVSQCVEYNRPVQAKLDYQVQRLSYGYLVTVTNNSSHVVDKIMVDCLFLRNEKVMDYSSEAVNTASGDSTIPLGEKGTCVLVPFGDFDRYDDCRIYVNGLY